MAVLTALPNELLDRVVSFVHVKKDLAHLRLVSRAWNDLSKPYYFATVPLYAHWEREVDDEDEDCDKEAGRNTKSSMRTPNDADYNAEIFKNILEYEEVRKLVKKVDIYTCNPDCDNVPSWYSGKRGSPIQGYSPDDELDGVWWECFKRLPELENLRSVALIFDRHGGSSDDYAYEEDILHSRWSRANAIQSLLELAGLNLQDLAIRHNQDLPVNPKETLESTDEVDEQSSEEEVLRIRRLGELQSLRMSLVHEQIRGESGTILKLGDSRQRLADFPTKWLCPATQLKHLTLYSDLPFGFFPKLELRGVHFPHLRTLAFGQYVISHDWQIDWIESHSATLRGIYFDHCSILFQIGHADPDWLDEEGYPTYNNDCVSKSYEMDEEYYNKIRMISYRTRWHQIFDRFAHSLPRLGVFRFGSSERWDLNRENRFDDASPGLPIMPWESETSIRNEIFEARYLHYNDWDEEYGVVWGDGEYTDIDFENKRWTGGMEEPPACKEEDERALRALLSKMEM